MLKISAIVGFVLVYRQLKVLLKLFAALHCFRVLRILNKVSLKAN